MSDLDHYLQTAKLAALAAGAELRGRAGKGLEVRHKGFRDLVSDRDLASQQAIVKTIAAACPDHTIWAEEDQLSLVDLSGPVWIVDPLDGTTNFVHGLDLYCVSICLTLNGRLEAGVIYVPEKDQTFYAARGQGAWLNDQPLRVSEVDRLSQALVVTGFAYDVENRLAVTLNRLGRALAATQGLRRLGSAALDLALVAAGQMDAFWEEGLAPWDMAAGALLVREAGGLVSDLNGQDYDLLSGRILAANPAVHRQMAELFNKE